MKMRSLSIVVAAVASLFLLTPVQAQYEGLSKFHWKRFIDKNEKKTAALIAADLAKAGAEYRAAEALANARLADFQNRIAAIEPIDLEAHGQIVQLAAVTVTVTSGEAVASSMPSQLGRDLLRILAAKIAERENLTTGSTRKAEPPHARHGASPAPQAVEPWWSDPISALLSKLGW